MPDFLVNEGVYESPTLEEAILEYTYRGFDIGGGGVRHWIPSNGNRKVFTKLQEKFFTTKILSVLRIEEDPKYSEYPGRKKFTVALDGDVLDLEIWGRERA